MINKILLFAMFNSFLYSSEYYIFDNKNEINEVETITYKDKNNDIEKSKFFLDNNKTIKKIFIKDNKEDFTFFKIKTNNNVIYLSNLKNNSIQFNNKDEVFSTILFFYKNNFSTQFQNMNLKYESNKLLEYLNDVYDGNIKNEYVYSKLSSIILNYSQNIDCYEEFLSFSKELFLDENKYLNYIKDNNILYENNNKLLSIYENLKFDLKHTEDYLLFNINYLKPIINKENNKIENEDYFLQKIVYEKLIKNKDFFNINNKPYLYKNQILEFISKYHNIQASDYEETMKRINKKYDKSKNKWDYLELIVLSELYNLNEKSKIVNNVFKEIENNKRYKVGKINEDKFKDNKLYLNLYKIDLNNEKYLFIHGITKNGVSISIVEKKYFLNNNLFYIDKNNINKILENSFLLKIKQ